MPNKPLTKKEQELDQKLESALHQVSALQMSKEELDNFFVSNHTPFEKGKFYHIQTVLKIEFWGPLLGHTCPKPCKNNQELAKK